MIRTVLANNTLPDARPDFLVHDSPAIGVKKYETKVAETAAHRLHKFAKNTGWF